MLRHILLFSCLALAVLLVPAEIPEPGDLALLLNEEEFEDYLDAWLEIEEQKLINKSEVFSKAARTGCEIRVNGDLGQPQPVYLHEGNYVVPTGNSGLIHLDNGEEITIACTGSGRSIVHPNIAASVATANATCVNGATIAGAGWLFGIGEFFDLTCSSNSFHEPEYTGELCWNGNRVIRVGFYVEGVFFPKYWSCFDPDRLEVVYVWYEQNPPNAVHQSGVARPSWLVNVFFPGVGINSRYTQVSQKAVLTELVGEELANKYQTTQQYLARGHLAAKTDFIFATGQRSTFYFINAAPQWQPFNAGNWNWLEQNLRARIGEAGYHTMVYTGTFGVTQMRDQNNRLVDYYLYTDANSNKQLPVPLYFYKVVYEPTLSIGTAFVSINNPYYSEAEVRALTFCTDRCRNNSNFDWLRWQLDRIDIGYSFCCEVDDFRRTIPHLPAFEVKNGLLY